MPRFSILLPTHNRHDVAGFAIESALAQTEPDFELLVVGDGCTDRTAEVVAGFRDPRVRWFDLPKAPSFGYANRNIVLREARGALIAYLAHDDLWLGNHLKLLGDAIARTDAEWIYSLPLWVSPDGVVVPGPGNLENQDELAAFLTVGNFIPSPCVVHRRSCFDKYGYWPEDGELGDWHYWTRIVEGGGRRNFGYLPTPTALHFKANWRATRDSGRADVGVEFDIADRASWWPESLKFAIPDGCPEQGVVWRALSRDGGSGQIALRNGVARVIARLARDAAEIYVPRIAALEDALETLTRDVAGNAALEAENARLQAALDDARGQLDRLAREGLVTSAARRLRNRLSRRGGSAFGQEDPRHLIRPAIRSDHPRTLIGGELGQSPTEYGQDLDNEDSAGGTMTVGQH